MIEKLKAKYNIHAFTSHRDEEGTKRWFLHFDLPPSPLCLFGHKPHTVTLDVGQFVECSRCFRRPPDYKRRGESHLEISRRYVDNFSVQVSIGSAGSETPLDAHLIVPGWRGFYIGTNLLGHIIANRKTARRRACGRKDEYDNNVVSLRIDKHSIWWKVWASRDSWSRGTPKWRDGSWNFYDAIYGKAKYERVEIAKANASLFMPEKNYDATLTLQRETWTRKRWIPPKIETSVEVHIPGGIPNGREKYGDWDATITFGVPTNGGVNWIEEAKKGATLRLMKDRERYTGNPQWVPPLNWADA